jgi:hypothetical protein
MEETMVEERDPKMEEKEEEKVQEKEEEKVEEKEPQDALSAIVFALILIWAGVVLLAHNFGFLDFFEGLINQLPLGRLDLPWEEISFFGATAWRLFFLGAGALVLIEVVIRLIVPEYRRRVFGSIIGAIVLIAVGLGSWNLIWPLILIAIGASILLRGVLGRRKL